MKLNHRTTAIVLMLMTAVTLLATSCTRNTGTRPANMHRVTLQLEPSKLATGVTADDKYMQRKAALLEERLHDKKINGTVSVQLPDRIVIEVPNTPRDIQLLETLLPGGPTHSLEFRHFYSVQNEKHPSAKYSMHIEPDSNGMNTYQFTESAGQPVDVKQVIRESTLILDSTDLKPVSKAVESPVRGQPVIDFEFTRDGTKKFADFTRENNGEYLAIILDGRILTVPVIVDTIKNGKAEISGFKSLAEAQSLADSLNASTLPFKVLKTETE